jgi:hypothetical protein
MRSGLTSDLAGYTLATAAILYTHPLAILVLPTHLTGFFLLRRVMDLQITGHPGRGPRLTGHRFNVFLAGLGIALVPYLPLLFRMGREFRLKLHGGSVANWLPVPGWGAPFETMVHYFMSPWVALLVLVLAVVPITARSLLDQRTRAVLLFCASIWAATTAIPWLVSETVTPVYLHRYSIPFLPILLLLLGWGCSEIPRRARGIVTMALFLLTAVPVHTYHTKIDKAPWREAFQELTGSLSSGDLVIFDPGWVDQLAAYYLQSPGGVARLSPYSLPETDGPLQAALRVWVVTETNGLLGMEGLLWSGEIPGWDLALHSVPNEAYEENPRALRLRRISITRFDRRLSGADTPAASGGTAS